MYINYWQKVRSMRSLVDKDEDKMGSFAPQQKMHTFDLPWTEAPQGFLARGDYKGKGLVQLIICSFWTTMGSFIVNLTT